MDTNRRFNKFTPIHRATIFVGVALAFQSIGMADTPHAVLGPAAALAFSQPMTQFEVFDGQRSFGPSVGAQFVLDTAANGIVVAAEAYDELRNRGYAVEGTFLEKGVAGFSEFDVSAPYTVQLTDHDGNRRKLQETRILSSAETSFCQLGLCPFYGIAGMPTMTGRVVSLDLTSGDIYDSLGSGDGIDTTISDSIPTTNLPRYSVPLNVVRFAAEGDGPIPTWADLPFMYLDPVHGGNRQTGNFVLDTGAQLSILSSELAFSLGLDANNNGSLADEAVSSIQIGGVGGTVNAPQLMVDELRIPTAEGVDLVLSDVQFAIVDIDPRIDGIFGMNLLASGGDLGGLGGLGDLGGLLGGGLGGGADDLEALLDLLGGFGGLGDLDDLLGGLGGLGGLGIGGATTDYFESAHFDFRTLQSDGTGAVLLDLKSSPSTVIPEGHHGDLNTDGVIDLTDRTIWVEDVQNTYFGDSNLDGVFNSKDLVEVFRAAEYEDGLVKNSTWATGDWNGDFEFNTRDLVTAFQGAGYDKAPKAAAAVPEPEFGLFGPIGLLIVFGIRRRLA